MKVTVEATIKAPIDRVWRAWTTPEDITQWNAASDDWHTTKASVDLRVGGAFSSRMEAKDGSAGFDFAGTYTNVVEHELLECSFGDRTMRVEFAASDGTVTVRETFDVETTNSVELQRAGWQAILDNFKRHVESTPRSMDARNESEPPPMKGRATVERRSEREFVVTRIVNGPTRIVFEAWTTPELFKRWWVPKSCGLSLLSCEMDVRAGGKYRLVFAHDASGPMEFFGKYLEVTPPSHLVWTNDEGEEEGAVTTVTFEDQGDQTRLVMHDLYPTKEALDAAIASGSTDAMPETLEQLNEVVITLGASGG